MSPLALSCCSYHEFQVGQALRGDWFGATRLTMTDGRLVGIRTHRFVGGLQALGGEAFGPACLDDALLVRGDTLRGFGDPLSDLVRDYDNPVLVTVQQVAGIDPHTSHLHGDSEVDQVDVRV